MESKIQSAFFVLLALGGTLFGVIAWRSWQGTWRIVQNGVQTSGTVTELVHRPRKGMDRGGTGLAPVVTFVTTDGKETRYYTQTYTTPALYAVGDPVDIWYLPEDPVQATLQGADAKILPLVFGLFGAAMCLIGYPGVIRMLIGLLVRKSGDL